MGLLNNLKSIFSKNNKENSKVSINSSPEDIRKYIDEQYEEMYELISSGNITDEEYISLRYKVTNLEEYKMYAGARQPSQKELEVSRYISDKEYAKARNSQSARVNTQFKNSLNVQNSAASAAAARKAILNGNNAQALSSNLNSMLNNDDHNSSSGR